MVREKQSINLEENMREGTGKGNDIEFIHRKWKTIHLT